MRESIRELRKLSKAGRIVELPSSMQVLCTFMLGAAFRVTCFLSRAVPEKC